MSKQRSGNWGRNSSKASGPELSRSRVGVKVGAGVVGVRVIGSKSMSRIT